jgi:hypothetical protein
MDRAMPRTFKLMTHDNQHGFGVSLMTYEDGEFVNGFTLHTMPDAKRRQTYLRDLMDLTGFELEDR